MWLLQCSTIIAQQSIEWHDSWYFYSSIRTYQSMAHPWSDSLNRRNRSHNYLNINYLNWWDFWMRGIVTHLCWITNETIILLSHRDHPISLQELSILVLLCNNSKIRPRNLIGQKREGWSEIQHDVLILLPRRGLIKNEWTGHAAGAWPVEGEQLQCRQNGSYLIYI